MEQHFELIGRCEIIVVANAPKYFGEFALKFAGQKKLICQHIGDLSPIISGLFFFNWPVTWRLSFNPNKMQRSLYISEAFLHKLIIHLVAHYCQRWTHIHISALLFLQTYDGVGPKHVDSIARRLIKP